MNRSQKALLDRLRELIEETPKSGALNAAKQPLYVTRFAQAVEARADDGGALVAYARAKVHEAPTGSYNAQVQAGRSDLTVEALVADAGVEWASEFAEADRAAARARLGTMIEAHETAQQAVEAEAAAHDRKIAAHVNARRIAKGKPGLTPAQEADMLNERGQARRRPLTARLDEFGGVQISGHTAHHWHHDAAPSITGTRNLHGHRTGLRTPDGT